MALATPIPVLRSVNEEQAWEFYIDFLAFHVDWERRVPQQPLYMQISREGSVLHLSSHDDVGLEAVVRIQVDDLDEFHAELLDRDRRGTIPAIATTPLGREFTVHDPFRNRLTFAQAVAVGEELLATPSEQAEVVALLQRDVVATLGERHAPIVEKLATEKQAFAARELFLTLVVDSVQQYFHDGHIDTVWPACPHHGNHPMWFEEGWWRADEQAVARLGELGDWLNSQHRSGK